MIYLAFSFSHVSQAKYSKKLQISLGVLVDKHLQAPSPKVHGLNMTSIFQKSFGKFHISQNINQHIERRNHSIDSNIASILHAHIEKNRNLQCF